MVYSITVVVITLKFTCVVFGTVLAPLTTLSLLHRRKKAPEENLGSLLNTSFVNNHSKLLNDGSYTTGTNGSTTFTLFEYHFSIYFLCFLWLKSAYFRWISQSYLYLHDFFAPFWHRILLLTKLEVYFPYFYYLVKFNNS